LLLTKGCFQIHRSVAPQIADAQPKESANPHQAPVPPKLGGAEIRERFLNFYEQHQHVRLPSSSLIPDDPTVLLTIAGMLQFKAIFMGQVGLLLNKQLDCSPTKLHASQIKQPFVNHLHPASLNTGCILQNLACTTGCI